MGQRTFYQAGGFLLLLAWPVLKILVSIPTAYVLYQGKLPHCKYSHASSAHYNHIGHWALSGE